MGFGSVDVYFLPGQGVTFYSLTELLLCLNLCEATNSPLATLTASLGLCYSAHRQFKASSDLNVVGGFFVLLCFHLSALLGHFGKKKEE